MSGSPRDVRVYHISIWRYLVMWWFLGPFILLGLGIAIFADPKMQGAGIIIVLLMLPFALLWHWLARRTKLTIAAQGLRSSEFGGALEVAWSEITGFRGDRGHEGFLTSQPMQGKGVENLLRHGNPMGAYDEQDLRWISERRYIPMRVFACHLRQGDLLGVIANYAPHLKEPLQAVHAPPPPRPSPTPQDKRRNRLAAAIIAASMAWGFILIWKGDQWQAWFFSVAYSLLDPLLAVAAGVSAWVCLRRRQWLMGVTSLVFFLIMFGWTLQHWSQLIELVGAKY